ncbi:MAG: hypothetical protein PVSMB10_16220 [Pseudarthrobacter sp.]
MGADVEGVDFVPAFVQEAEARFPATRFRVASFTNLGISDGQIVGIHGPRLAGIKATGSARSPEWGGA